ncbi:MULTISPECIES: HVO_0758 family zinc finger protein [unclassified Halorhabdus]|uniref:HVO_0758 family zinc finger protein n=1 Tax=unclassified Halorhabdus TaxID=2621901 RepID=UPI0018A6C9CC|nr:MULTISPECIES: HVO_0758 family zinc finger protein [unclassified Halorhabdus]
MKSVRKGLRSGDLKKDTYERLRCADCDEELKTENDPEEVGSVRACPECGRRWQQVG